MARDEFATTPRKAWWTALVAGMASYIDSAGITTSGIAIVMLQGPLHLSTGEVGAVASILTFMIAIGALIGGRLGDRFGRRKVFMVTMIMIIVAAVVIITAPSFTNLVIGTGLMGLGTGADLPVSLATISEAAEHDHRGRMVAFSHMLWKIGIIITQAIGSIVGDWGRAGAQILYAHLGIIAVLVFLGRLTIPESARWKAARTARALESAQGRKSADVDVPALLKQLVTKPFVVPFVALMVFYTLTNLGANTNGQFGAYIFTKVAGASVSLYSRIGLLTTLVGFLLVFVLMKVVDGSHRIAWFIVGTLAAVVGSGLPLVIGPKVPTLTIMLVMWSVFSVFAGEPMMKVWTQESFPTMLRSTAQGIIVAVARASAALLALVTPAILAAGPRVLFAFILAVTLIGTIWAFLTFRHRTSTAFEAEDEVLTEAVETSDGSVGTEEPTDRAVQVTTR